MGIERDRCRKICFWPLTFWSATRGLGLGIAYHPEAAAAIDSDSVWLNGWPPRHPDRVAVCGLGWCNPAASAAGNGP